MDRKALESLNLEQLRGEARMLELDSSGIRAVMIDRLLNIMNMLK